MKDLLVLLVLFGCGCSSAKNVVHFQNDYDFYEDRYEARCVKVPAPAPPKCKDIRLALKTFREDLDKAVWAVGSDGKRLARPDPKPLQLDLCKEDEALVVRLLKEK